MSKKTRGHTNINGGLMYNLEFRTRNWEKELGKIFEGVAAEQFFTPATEILDDEKSFHISLDIPGLTQENIDIEVVDNELRITGERKAKSSEEKDSVLRTDKRYGKFSKVFTLPQNVNADEISAHFENGVLDVALPKVEKPQPKKITVTSKNALN